MRGVQPGGAAVGLVGVRVYGSIEASATECLRVSDERLELAREERRDEPALGLAVALELGASENGDPDLPSSELLNRANRVGDIVERDVADDQHVDVALRAQVCSGPGASRVARATCLRV